MPTICPKCGSAQTTIQGMSGRVVWYVCDDCGQKFSTHAEEDR